MPRGPPVTTATRAIYASPQCLPQLKDVDGRDKPGHYVNISCVASSAFDAHRDAHAAADAQRREALFGVALLHLEQQRGQHARAGRADRMPDRDRAAVDVDLVGIPAKVLVDRAGLRGERLV